MVRSHRREALRIYYGMIGARSFLFWTAFVTGAIYYIQRVGLDPLQLVLVGTVLEFTTFLCEIPTGVIADVYGRKLSVIVGFAVIGAGFVLQGAVPSLAAILGAQVLYGGGWTFISGAEDAWLADEIGLERLPHAYSRARQISFAASLAGVAASVSLASVSLQYPFLVSGLALLVVALVLVGVMPETEFRPSSHSVQGTWRKMTVTLSAGLHAIRASSLLLVILGMTLVFGVSREGIDRLWEAHILATTSFPVLGELKPVVWFGIINAIAMLAALVISLSLHHWMQALGRRRAVAWLSVRYILLGVAILGFALARSFGWIVAAYIAVYTIREVGDAIQSAWVNGSVTSDNRATVLSTISQMDAIGQAAGGPILGLIGTRLGLRASMIAASILTVPVLGLLRRARRYL
jgi:MFS transporter, DHA3 family, tetracycline resistance protein